MLQAIQNLVHSDNALQPTHTIFFQSSFCIDKIVGFIAAQLMSSINKLLFEWEKHFCA